MKLLISDYLTKLCGTNLKGLEVWGKMPEKGYMEGGTFGLSWKDEWDFNS